MGVVMMYPLSRLERKAVGRMGEVAVGKMRKKMKMAMVAEGGVVRNLLTSRMTSSEMKLKD